MKINKRRDLGLGTYRWTTSEPCLVLGEWIVLNAQIRELYRIMKEVDERIDEGVLRWFGHLERMEKKRIAKGVYAGECSGSCSVGRLRKILIDTVKDYLRKRCLDVRKASKENGAG